MRKKIFVGAGFVVIFLLIALIFMPCGRTQSRLLGKVGRQKLEISDMKNFISISFYKKESSTIKDVTFEADDGYVYTQEFKDLSPLEGAIRWVPSSEGSDFILSRTISRWFGGAVDLALPEDCVEVLGVDVTAVSKDERVKNLTYRSKKGEIFSKEYREGFVDRNFEGWLEIVSEKK